ncbi:HAD superfamily subfamily IIIB acid phosphatase [Euphorbia peplus]|nr:HAD superfamily subfamily IIIB acid phosphatase [Euphorbia peplus]
MNLLNQNGCRGCFAELKHLSQKRHLELYTELQAKGWSMILLSRKPDTLRNATEEYLISIGYRSWSSVIMR